MMDDRGLQGARPIGWGRIVTLSMTTGSHSMVAPVSSAGGTILSAIAIFHLSIYLITAEMDEKGRVVRDRRGTRPKVLPETCRGLISEGSTPPDLVVAVRCPRTAVHFRSPHANSGSRLPSSSRGTRWGDARRYRGGQLVRPPGAGTVSNQVRYGPRMLHRPGSQWSCAFPTSTPTKRQAYPVGPPLRRAWMVIEDTRLWGSHSRAGLSQRPAETSPM